MYNKHKMNASSQIKDDNYNSKTSFLIRLTGLFAPIVAVAYGFLARFEIIKIDHSPTNQIIGNLDLYIISFLLLALGIWQLVKPFKSQFGIVARLFTYQILLGAFLIFISGLTPPFVAFWILLTLESWVYLQKKGMYISLLLFLLVVLVNTFIYQPISTQSIIFGMAEIILVSYVSWVVIQANVANDARKAELSNSKTKESLQRDQFLTIINNLTDAVMSVDMDGVIRVSNAASLNLLDTNENLTGKNINKVLPLINQEHNPVNIFTEFKKAKTVIKRDDLVYTFDDQEEIRLELTYSPIRSSFSRSKKTEPHDGYIVIARDVTKAKSLEEERDEFISVISHELRTPITIAEGTISNVQVMMDHPNITQKMLKDGINLAHDQVLFLANMVNDLSALSRAERGVADNAEIINVDELAHQMINKYLPDAKAKKLQLDLDLEPKIGSVNVSRLYLEELLQNFITNAIKYTKKGNIKMIFSKKNGNINFAVKDSGIGISKSDQAKVFGKFYRSEDYRTRETGGTGLGLYVATKLAHKLNTQIQLTSRLNIGSTFSFELPEYKE